MKKRLLGIAMLLPLLLAFYVGGIVLKLTALVLSVLGIMELYASFKLKNTNMAFWLGTVACALFFINSVFPVSDNWTKIFLVVAFFLSALLVVMEKSTIIDIAVAWLGVVYVAFPLNAIVNLYEMELYGKQLSALIFVIAFASDTFAYLVGCKFGKHKLIPKISPNKTIEGSIGAVIGSVLITMLYCHVVGFNVLNFVPIAIIGSIISQLGDLFASSIKRYNGVKDFGNLIPGHGGVLDRFDSVLFLALLISIVPVTNILA